MKIIGDYVLVRPNSVTGHKSDSGLFLRPDVYAHFNHGDAIVTSGLAVEVPHKPTRKEQLSDKSIVEFPAPIRPGDGVVFHHAAIKNATETGMVHEGCYFIPYDLIHAFIRDGQIHAVGNYFICEPIPGKLDDILTSSGLLTKTKVDPEVHRGIVRYMGHIPPEFQDVQPGMIVAFTLKAMIPIKLPGYEKDLIRCRWRNLLFAYKDTITDEELAERIRQSESLEEEIQNAYDSHRNFQS
jgi:hypothetical protein